MQRHTRRILSKLFTNKFEVECSWTNQAFEKDVIKFKFPNLNMVAIMKSVESYLFFIILFRVENNAQPFFFRCNNKSTFALFRF